MHFIKAFAHSVYSLSCTLNFSLMLTPFSLCSTSVLIRLLPCLSLTHCNQVSWKSNLCSCLKLLLVIYFLLFVPASLVAFFGLRNLFLLKSINLGCLWILLYLPIFPIYKIIMSIMVGFFFNKCTFFKHCIHKWFCHSSLDLLSELQSVICCPSQSPGRHLSFLSHHPHVIAVKSSWPPVPRTSWH